MSQQTDPAVISKQRVVYATPEMETVSVRRDIPFTGSGGVTLLMDVYSPSPVFDGMRRPVVVMVEGYPDPGVTRILGCRFKEMGSTVSWAQLIAASGLVAVASTNHQPEADLRAMVEHLTSHAEELGIDTGRMGVWATSGHGPLALSLLLASLKPRAVALLYPYLMDLGEATAVSSAAATFRFVDACAGRTLSDLADDVPVFLARAGQDQMPGLNDALDRFVAAALAANLPLTVVNHATGPHAFDLFDDTPQSRTIVRAVLAFLRDCLT
jgi:hypothetical protein